MERSSPLELVRSRFTDKHDVVARLEKLLKDAGFHVGVLRASVALARREDWIAEHAPSLDVVISHPRLVETGLDLFDKGSRHNFPTLVFYETGYNLFTLRQAARRSWRIGQRQACRIVYFHYEGTMQERAMALMGKKLTAAQALEGTFSSEGLVALAGEDANVEIALARSLVERMDEGDVRRMWNKVVDARARSVAETDLHASPMPVDLWSWLEAVPVAPTAQVVPEPSVGSASVRAGRRRRGLLFDL